MRACQGLGTPTKKPGFYLISGLESIIVVKNPVSGASPLSQETGFLAESVAVTKNCRKNPVSGAPRSGFFVDGRTHFWVDGRSAFHHHLFKLTLTLSAALP